MNLGGGANASGLGSDNITGSVNATYGFTDKRQTNFATIGEGNIIIRDESSTGDPEKYNSLKRDVSISQYNTKDGGLQGGFTVDADTVNLVVDTVNKIDKLIENPKDTIVADYNKIVAEAKEIYKKVDERNDKIIAGAKELEKQAEIIVEKTGNLVGSGHFTTDDKVQYYLNMDEYEAAKANGGEITVLDTLVYVKSKSAAGEELTGADLSDLRLSSGFVLDGATDAIKENLEANIRINSREEVLASLAVLDMFDADAAADARGYLSGVRDSDARNNEIAVQQNNNSTELVLSVNSSNTGVPGLLEGWGQALSSWGAERNKEAAVLNKDITDSAIVQSGHRAGEWMNENPDQVLSTITDFTPIIGQGKGVIDAVRGKDLITKEELAGWQIGLSLASVIPVGKVVDKVGDVLKHVDDIADATQKLHKNSNAYVGNQGVYEIIVDGKLEKYGKADMTSISSSTGNPRRLQTQLDALEKKFPDKDITGRVIYQNENISTKEIKKIETDKIQKYYDKNGDLPPKNQNHPGIEY